MVRHGVSGGGERKWQRRDYLFRRFGCEPDDSSIIDYAIESTAGSPGSPYSFYKFLRLPLLIVL